MISFHSPLYPNMPDTLPTVSASLLVQVWYHSYKDIQEYPLRPAQTLIPQTKLSPLHICTTMFSYSHPWLQHFASRLFHAWILTSFQVFNTPLPRYPFSSVAAFLSTFWVAQCYLLTYYYKLLTLFKFGLKKWDQVTYPPGNCLLADTILTLSALLTSCTACCLMQAHACYPLNSHTETLLSSPGSKRT